MDPDPRKNSNTLRPATFARWAAAMRARAAALSPGRTKKQSTLGNEAWKNFVICDACHAWHACQACQTKDNVFHCTSELIFGFEVLIRSQRRRRQVVLKFHHVTTSPGDECNLGNLLSWTDKTHSPICNNFELDVLSFNMMPCGMRSLSPHALFVQRSWLRGRGGLILWWLERWVSYSICELC